MEPYKLDETIKEFEIEVEKIKSVNEMYEKLDITHKEIIESADIYRNISEEVLEIQNKLENILMNYEESQRKFMEFNNEIKENLEKEIAALKLENINFNKDIIENIEKLDEAYDKRFFEMRRENRESYQELEKLLASKLERTKSDIEVSIRDGNVNLERVIGNQFDLKFIQFNELVVKKFEQIEKKTSRIFIAIGSIFTLVALNIIIHFIYK
jgi:hypothetical protein